MKKSSIVGLCLCLAIVSLNVFAEETKVEDLYTPEQLAKKRVVHANKQCQQALSQYEFDAKFDAWEFSRYDDSRRFLVFGGQINVDLYCSAEDGQEYTIRKVKAKDERMPGPIVSGYGFENVIPKGLKQVPHDEDSPILTIHDKMRIVCYGFSCFEEVPGNGGYLAGVNAKVTLNMFSKNGVPHFIATLTTSSGETRVEDQFNNSSILEAIKFLEKRTPHEELFPE